MDALVELEFLHEFASSLDTLLSEAAARPKSELPPLSESLSIVALDRADLYGEVFPPFVHEAFLISSIVFLDRQFRTYAEGLRRALPITLRLNELAGSTLDRFRLFCETVSGVDLQLTSENWQDLDGLVSLRNCFIHAGGILEGSRDRKPCEHFIRKHGTPEIRDGQIGPSTKTSGLVLRILTETIEKIYAAALRRFPERGGASALH